ncbi:heavy-metal-associated domain-containing protein [Candidatus Woesearchaeota archaeon]|nr:heavy-metal-associated domain-containing protein [Candidatus Woesearchaeota archaeon]MCF8013413.1 heavy-metal-associated domain-containing protein [Candidatus Woesearchaeota archaeon]
MKENIYIPDIECDSCSRVLKKAFDKEDGIIKYVVYDDSTEIEFDESKINTKDIISIIKSKGFRASTEPFERKTLKERMRHFKENPSKYVLESKIIPYTIGLFLIISALEVLAYFLFLKNIPDFLSNYSWWILYLNISIATISVGMWHVIAYLKNKITCMTGMMIGMTIGMQTGMMIGAIVGATNGFFIGSMVGMLLGCLVGWITGKCCGIMGTMEGLMAGLMGGTMGPMISIMMFSDNLLIFMPFYIAINVLILGGLSIMMYEEVVEGKKHNKQPVDFMTLSSIAVIATFILLAIIIYGPKSPLVSF